MGEMKQVIDADQELIDRIDDEDVQGDIYADGSVWVPVSFNEEGYTYGS